MKFRASKLRVSIAALAFACTTAFANPACVRAAPPQPATADPYGDAARAEDVPLNLLIAVAGAESGYHPWALNLDGREIYCATREEAQRMLDSADDVAIGLMQINWGFWGPRFGLTKTQLLDPATNLRYGARILKNSLERDGSLWMRISNYHSGSLATRDKYNRHVYDTYLHYMRGDFTR
jgi:soluble lytic murein transglycosylase-like protein